MRVLLWLLLLASIAFPLLCVLGCRQRDGLIDTGPLFVDSTLLPDNFGRPMPPTAEGAVMAEAKPVTVTIDATGVDTVRDALARREAKIAELQEIIRDHICSECGNQSPKPECDPCCVYDALQWGVEWLH